MHRTMYVAYHTSRCSEEEKVDIRKYNKISVEIPRKDYYCKCGVIVRPRHGRYREWSFFHLHKKPHKLQCEYYELPQRVITEKLVEYDIEFQISDIFLKTEKKIIFKPGDGLLITEEDKIDDELLPEKFLRVNGAEERVRTIEAYLNIYNRYLDGERLRCMNKVLRGRDLERFFIDEHTFNKGTYYQLLSNNMEKQLFVFVGKIINVKQPNKYKYSVNILRVVENNVVYSVFLNLSPDMKEYMENNTGRKIIVLGYNINCWISQKEDKVFHNININNYEYNFDLVSKIFG